MIQIQNVAPDNYNHLDELNQYVKSESMELLRKEKKPPTNPFKPCSWCLKSTQDRVDQYSQRIIPHTSKWRVEVVPGFFDNSTDWETRVRHFGNSRS